MAEYDTLLKDHNSPRNATYVSNTIQNQLITAIYQNLLQELKQDIGVANCYSVMMDEASDCGHQEQVSIVIRYVDCNFVIQERLVNLVNTSSTDAESLYQILLN